MMRIWRKWRNPRQKPPFGAQIDWSDPITDGLCDAFLFNESLGNRQFSNASGVNILEANASLLYNGLYFDGESYSRYTPSKRVIDPDGEWSVFFVCNWLGGDDQAFIWHPRAERDYSLLVYYGRLVLWIYTGTKYSLYGDYLSTNRLFSCSVTNKNGLYTIYTNVNKNSGSYPTPNSTTSYNSLGGQPQVSTTRYYRGFIYLFYLFERALTDSEIERLHYEPYSFFLTPFPWFMVDLGAGPTYQQEVSGSVSLFGSLGTAITYRETLSGSVSLEGSALSLPKKSLQGDLTLAGDIIKAIVKGVSGSVTSTGSVETYQGTTVSPSGAVGPSGDLLFRTDRRRSVSGDVTSSGSLSVLTKKVLTGSVRPYGVQINDQEELKGEDKMIGSRQKGVVP